MDVTRQTIEDADLSKLNEKDKSELRQFLQHESKRSEIQASAYFSYQSLRNFACILQFLRVLLGKIANVVLDTHGLTEVCWKKCITGTIKSGKLDKSEQTCLSNCVQRVLDINFLTVKHLEKMRQQ